VSTGRLESFSDGVIAVAITLLVLDIAVPTLRQSANGVQLGHDLSRQWPVYAAYVTSFITIGIIWINHHMMIGRLARADHSILMLNLLLLLTIAVIPFGTALFAEYLREAHGAKLAGGIYGAIFLVMAVAFAMLNTQILLRRPHLLRVQLTGQQRRRILARSVTGLVPYVVATALAAVSPYITLAIMAALAVFYAMPIASGSGVSAA
jgi:TMEM175 potassium channel family protein